MDICRTAALNTTVSDGTFTVKSNYSQPFYNTKKIVSFLTLYDNYCTTQEAPTLIIVGQIPIFNFFERLISHAKLILMHEILF